MENSDAVPSTAERGADDANAGEHPAGEIKISVLRRATLRAGLLAGAIGLGGGTTVDPGNSTHSTVFM
ncbi:hypothetical protein OG589_33715 [Sphaerisporangium sp. NBC_01403]|uniref:hypothetical protein n=1 Tax=Sphaerisporangium TaxID=321315 RepID=UPI0032511165